MHHDNNLPPHDEQSIEIEKLEHDISNLTLGVSQVNSGQIGDNVSVENQNQVSQLDNAVNSPATPSETTATVIFYRAKTAWSHFMQSNNPEYMDEAISLYRQALQLQGALDPERFFPLNNLACILQVRFMNSSRPEDLEEFVLLLQEALEFRPPSHPERALSLFNLAAGLSTRFMQCGRREDLEQAIDLHRQALELRPLYHPERHLSLDNLASNLSTQFEQLGRREDLEEAISLYRQGLKLQPKFHPCRSLSLSNLACALSNRFKYSGQRKDLEEGTVLFREALELSPPSHPSRAFALDNLASNLSTECEQFGRREDLENAISMYREALELRPLGHQYRPSSLSNLASALRKRFLQSGFLKDLEDAIVLLREALELRPVPHPHRSLSLSNLALALTTQFEQSGRLHELDEAITLNRESLKLRPPSHAEQASSLDNLAYALRTRFTQTGRHEDLNEATLLSREALKLRPASHHLRYLSLNILGGILFTQFEQFGRRKDLEEAIVLHRQALEVLHESHSERPVLLSSLSMFLRARFYQSGRPEDLEDVILLQRQVLDMILASNPHRSRYLNNLGAALFTRFELSGLFQDLEELILLHREALELQPEPHPGRSFSIDNLAVALLTRFSHSNRLQDLEEAISLHRQALTLRPASHADRYLSLNNLASALTRYYSQAGVHKDLEEAISLYRQADEFLPASHSRRWMVVMNLADALETKSGESNNPNDLQEAISLHRQALKLRPESNPDRLESINGLAIALLTKYNQSGRHEVFEEAIDVSSQSTDGLVTGHPLACLLYQNQGIIYFSAYSRTQQSQYLHKAMDYYQSAVACDTAPAFQRFRVARRWAREAGSIHDSALNAYRAAIQLLPRLAMLGLDLSSRQQALISRTDGLARDAASCAIRVGEYDHAVELLEQGRAVFWSQALQLRTPMNDLRDVAPELEAKLRRISLALEQGSVRDISKNLDTRGVFSMEKQAAHFRRLNDEWLETLEEVRRLEGFQDFLLPLKISTLLGAAIEAPVVIVNASSAGCDALMLTSTGVQHIPFVNLTFATVTRLVELIQIATSPESRDGSLPESNRAHMESIVHEMPSLFDAPQRLKQTLERGGLTRAPWTDLTFKYVLGMLWKSVVEPVIRQLGLKKSESPSHLRWCPTGPFTFLPLHAAGAYDIDDPECLSDYVFSSYTPTISTLLRNTPLPHTPTKMVVIIQPELRYTTEELQRIEAHIEVIKAQVPDMEFVKLVSGSLEQVTSHLSTASIAHFACHGTQDAQNPLESALLLKDRHHLTVHRIMQQSSPNAMFAFLAACQTATGDKTLPDEVIHLGSTLLFAGFPGVVATMWNILDVDGPVVADAFYGYLFNNTSADTENTFWPDTTRAARALHLAVAKLRSEKNVSFIRWVPFIHMGR